MGPDLFAARTGRCKVLGGVALDLRCAAAAGLDLVPEVPQLIGELGLVDRGGELLGIEQSPFLKSARSSVGSLGVR
jgi:hypothetical protein